MPNIEIHGYSPEVAEMLKKQIFEELFANKPYAGDMVVGIVTNPVADNKGFPQPFIRLLDSDPREAEEILQILQEKLPGADLEFISIKFIPKKTDKTVHLTMVAPECFHKGK